MNKIIASICIVFLAGTLFLVVGEAAKATIKSGFVSCSLVKKTCTKIPWYMGTANGAEKQYRCGNYHVRQYGNRCIAHRDAYAPSGFINSAKHIWYDVLSLPR